MIPKLKASQPTELRHTPRFCDLDYPNLGRSEALLEWSRAALKVSDKQNDPNLGWRAIRALRLAIREPSAKEVHFMSLIAQYLASDDGKGRPPRPS